jgi:DNA-nicking Smr family endonuclease
MDFGDILDEWERETAKPHGKKSHKAARPSESGERAVTPSASETRANPMDAWLRRYGVEDKDSATDQRVDAESPAERRRRLRSARPDAVIDLHGLTRDDAWARLTAFFADARRRGFGKVLIIHGKGSHSAEDPVLGPLVRLFIERNPHAGESGHSSRDEGGTGSTWVILK